MRSRAGQGSRGGYMIGQVTWVAHAVLIVVVGQVGVGRAAAPGKLQHHHARRAYALPELMHVRRDDAQVLCYDGYMPQFLQGGNRR